ncbi:MAG: hypothetical protein U5J97_12155 [Trueperaceae bacterium]|nr:hypothetical protein [Trueperaceae bacterium]
MRTVVLVLVAATTLSVQAQVQTQAPGRLALDPAAASVGATVVAVGTGLPEGVEAELVWETADADWNVRDGRFLGVTAEATRWSLASGTTDANGAVRLSFEVPEDYGYIHNLFLVVDDEDVARNGLAVVPELTVTPASGPVGSDVTVRLTGIGYRFWESVWHLLYDGTHTGWLSAMTTRGTAEVTIPATGAPGLHTLQVLSGAHPVPYLNQQQAPIYKPQIPTVLGATFEVTDGPAIPAPAASGQGLPRASGTPVDGSSGPALGLGYASGPVGSDLTVSGAGFAPDQEVVLSWTTVRGNRISGGGWDEVELPLAEIRADGEGRFETAVETPDDLGGEHRILARPAAPGTSGAAPGGAAEPVAEARYTITPSVLDIEPAVVQPGGDLTITIKGVGWTETANIYTLLMDNGYLGYGCGFNSQGDVTIHLKAPGGEGLHLIELYPSIYQGVLTGPSAPSPDSTANATYLQLPMLNHVDHPGEELPAFRLSFEVRAP